MSEIGTGQIIHGQASGYGPGGTGSTAVTDWQDISTAPHPEEGLLLFYNFRPEEVTGIDLCYWEDGTWWTTNAAGQSVARAQGAYTHWQLLPEPPK